MDNVRAGVNDYMSSFSDLATCLETNQVEQQDSSVPPGKKKEPKTRQGKSEHDAAR
jgi:hypothetical protein